VTVLIALAVGLIMPSRKAAHWGGGIVGILVLLVGIDRGMMVRHYTGGLGANRIVLGIGMALVSIGLVYFGYWIGQKVRRWMNRAATKDHMAQPSNRQHEDALGKPCR